VAVMGGRFTIGAGVIVTVEPGLLTTPVKSSIRSSCPAWRLEFVRGSAKVLAALVLAKFRLRVVPVKVMTWPRSMLMANPPLALTVCAVVAVAVKGPANEAMQTAFGEVAGHAGLVRVMPVPLEKASVALRKLMETEE